MKKEFLIELDQYLLRHKEELFAESPRETCLQVFPSGQSQLSRPLEIACRRVNGEGCWALLWHEVEGAIGYEVQTNPNPGHSSQWRVAEMGPAPFFYFQAQPMETQVWIRVRALLQNAAGLWSDPVRLLADDLPWQQAA